MNVGKPVGKNTEYGRGDVEVNAVFNGEPVELLEESINHMTKSAQEYEFSQMIYKQKKT